MPTVRPPSNTIGGSHTDLCEAGRVFSKNRLTVDRDRGQLNSGCSEIARQMEVPGFSSLCYSPCNFGPTFSRPVRDSCTPFGIRRNKQFDAMSDASHGKN